MKNLKNLEFIVNAFQFFIAQQLYSYVNTPHLNVILIIPVLSFALNSCTRIIYKCFYSGIRSWNSMIANTFESGTGRGDESISHYSHKHHHRHPGTRYEMLLWGFSPDVHSFRKRILQKANFYHLSLIHKIQTINLSRVQNDEEVCL